MQPPPPHLLVISSGHPRYAHSIFCSIDIYITNYTTKPQHMMRRVWCPSSNSFDATQCNTLLVLLMQHNATGRTTSHNLKSDKRRMIGNTESECKMHAFHCFSIFILSNLYNAGNQIEGGLPLVVIYQPFRVGVQGTTVTLFLLFSYLLTTIPSHDMR